jgi:large subunit ribosomal protein L24
MEQLMRPNRSKLKRTLLHKPSRWNIVRGDTVQVIQRNHPEYGRQGTVSQVIRDKMRVIVEGVNIAPWQIKGDPERGIKGQTIMKERSIHYSNVNLVDPVTGFPTKVTYSYLDDGTKVRISKRSGAIIPKPDILKQRSPRNFISSKESDTLNDDDVWATTYKGRPSKWASMREELLNSLGEKNKEDATTP